jgi:hypothetical protein
MGAWWGSRGWWYNGAGFRVVVVAVHLSASAISIIKAAMHWIGTDAISDTVTSKGWGLVLEREQKCTELLVLVQLVYMEQGPE